VDHYFLIIESTIPSNVGLKIIEDVSQCSDISQKSSTRLAVGGSDGNWSSENQFVINILESRQHTLHDGEGTEKSNNSPKKKHGSVVDGHSFRVIGFRSR